MFLLDTLLKDKCMCLQGELKLSLQDKSNIEIFLTPDIIFDDYTFHYSKTLKSEIINWRSSKETLKTDPECP